MAEYPLVDNTIFEADEEYIPQPEPEPQAPAWMDGSVRIGIHTSIAGSYLNALESEEAGGECAADIFGEPADVARGDGTNPGVGRESISDKAGRVGAGAAGDSRELSGESGGNTADAADAVDSGVS